MRTFRRPMFRKGGNVDNGIMTGIVDRTQAQDGYLPGSTAEMKGAMGVTEEGINLSRRVDPKINIPDTTGDIDISLMEDRPVPKYLSEEYTGGVTEADLGTPKTVEEYLAQLKKGAGEYGGMDPLTSFLLTAGPSVAGATSFADAVNKLQPATKQLISQADAKAKYDRDLRKAAVNLGLQEEQKFDDRRFNLLLKADDREYQKFLTDDERNYLAEVKNDDRLYNKDLIKNEREFNLELLQDSRRYDKLKEEDRRAYDLQIEERARAYQKLDEEKKRAYEEKLIKEGRAFELQQIIRAEEFKKDMYNLEKEEAKKYTEKDFLEVYEGDTLQARNRAKFENEKLKTKILEKFGSQFEGFINGPNDITEQQLIKNKENKKVGKVYYDVNTGKIKRFRKTTEGYVFEEIDIDTFVEEDPPKGSTEAEKKAEIDKRFEFLSDDQRKILEEIKNRPPDPYPGA
jgi:hypothetical protein